MLGHPCLASVRSRCDEGNDSVPQNAPVAYLTVFLDYQGKDPLTSSG